MTSPSPDIVVIVIDDLGFSDLGCYGSEVRTPNLDALAADGLRFTRFDTRAICAPSRAALLTGRNSHSVGMADLPARSREEANAAEPSFSGVLSLDVPLLPELLRQRDYSTVALGKWHLSPEYHEEGPGPHDSWPVSRGFDRFYGFIGGYTDQYAPTLVSDRSQPSSTPRGEDYHLTADLIDRALEELERSESDDTPTFLYLSTGAVHSPHQVPARYRDRYRGVYDEGWDVVRQRRFERQLELGILPPGTELPPRNDGDKAWDDLTPLQKRVYARYQENYAGFVEHTDEHLGRLFARIRERRSSRETVVIVISDNGPAPEGDHHGNFRRLYQGEDTSLVEVDKHLDEMGAPTTSPMYPRPWAMVGATPFRRYKLWPFAGGMRAPLVVWSPDHVSDPGTIREQFTELIDLAPTILEMAGGDPHERGAQGMHGRSFVHALRSPTAATRSTQYFELRSNRAITDGEWKAIAMHVPGASFDSDEWALFHVASDFSETHDVSAEHPEVLSHLIALWHREASRYSEPPTHEMPELQRSLGYFDDAYPPRNP